MPTPALLLRVAYLYLVVDCFCGVLVMHLHGWPYLSSAGPLRIRGIAPERVDPAASNRHHIPCSTEAELLAKTRNWEHRKEVIAALWRWNRQCQGRRRKGKPNAGASCLGVRYYCLRLQFWARRVGGGETKFAPMSVHLTSHLPDYTVSALKSPSYPRHIMGSFPTSDPLPCFLVAKPQERA